MLITHIVAENFIGLRMAQVAIRKPVTLFAGSNGAGKSSLQEAVRMALTGESVRVSLKKEYQAIVNEGGKQGFAQVVMHDGKQESSATIMLPSGKASGENYTAPAALPYVLDAQRFARLDEKERRAFLFGLMGLKTDLASVKERLLARKLDPAKVERVLPMLRAGFDAASKDAKTKATEAKGAWRAVTGETYGAVKAADWRAERPEVDTAAMRKAEENLARLDSELAAANQILGARRADKQRHDQQQARLPELRDQAAKKARIQAKLAKDEADLTEWDRKVAEVEGGGAAAPAALTCPCCQAQLVLREGALQQHEAGAAHPDVDKLPQYRNSRDLLKSAVANDKRDLQAATDAAATITAIEIGLKDAPKTSEVDEAAQAVAELTKLRATAAGQLEQHRKAKTAAEAADASTKKAASAHADVQAWDAIGDALAPDGIPGEILAEALEPINDRLAQAAADADWPQVEIGKDMVVTAGGRSYALLSESEKWRTDAMLAEAISFQSGLRLLVLDRFDVLDVKGRGDLLAWLHVLAENKEVDTTLVFGTLKALPADLPATVAGEWIENGQVGQHKEAA